MPSRIQHTFICNSSTKVSNRTPDPVGVDMRRSPVSREFTQEQLQQLFRLDDEVIEIEDHDGKKFPVVRTYDDGKYHLRFWCNHCRTWHLHGRGGPDAPYEEGRSGMAGHRSAHCTVRNSPFKPNGVILDVVGRYDTCAQSLHRKGTSLYCPKCRSEYSAAFNACGCGRFVNKKRKPSHPNMAEKYEELLNCQASGLS